MSLPIDNDNGIRNSSLYHHKFMNNSNVHSINNLLLIIVKFNTGFGIALHANQKL